MSFCEIAAVKLFKQSKNSPETVPIARYSRICFVFALNHAQFRAEIKEREGVAASLYPSVLPKPNPQCVS